MRIRIRGLRSLLLLAGLLAVVEGKPAVAQYLGVAVEPGSMAKVTPAGIASAEPKNELIAPGDLISIQTYGVSELTFNGPIPTVSLGGQGSAAAGGVKLGYEGEIVLPYLGVVKLAGMTAAEASTYLARLLKEKGILVDPQVAVQIADSESRLISVNGEVAHPMSIPLTGHFRLFDVIAACGGLTPFASHTITIRRVGQPESIQVDLGVDANKSDIDNILMEPGDTVLVPHVGNVYIVGQVKNQEAIPLAGNTPVTLLRAVTMAGGVTFSAGLSKTSITRSTPDGQKVKIIVDLKKVMYGKQQDVTLLADDVVYVPMNGFKGALANGAAGVASSLLYGVVYASTVIK